MKEINKSAMDRREFLGAVGTVAASTAALTSLASLAEAAVPVAPAPVRAAVTGGAMGSATPVAPAAPILLRPFDYKHVTLGASRWQKQFVAGQEFYQNVSDDDILCGFRRTAHLAAPGKPLGGWCNNDSSTVFGQWLQGMSRNDNPALREKAGKLIDEWSKTVGADNDPHLRHYPWEKVVGGLSDATQYMGHDKAPALMERITDWGIANLDRSRIPAANTPWEMHSGRPGEWYTLSENLYRAYLLTGKAKYKDFGDVWKYDAYWNKFADTNDPKNAQGVHAYSHANSFSSAAMSYMVDGDKRTLQILKNFYEWMQNAQTYASGGFGPAERFVYHDGALGESLLVRLDSFECGCDSWASFKLGKYLTMFTGESRYGDWIERILYNGVGGSLWITDNGKHTYYLDYHLGAGQKTFARATYTCCSGTYIQDIVEYQNLIYLQDDAGLYVNLYLPSTVEWNHGGHTVKLTQETEYPEAELVSMKIDTPTPTTFPLKMRIPAWAQGVTFKVNGTPVTVDAKPGQWATVQREWRTGDKLEMTIPLKWRRASIDKWHPDRVAIVRGPVVWVQDVPHRHVVSIPKTDVALNQWMVPTRRPGVFQYQGQEQASQRDDFRPFYALEEMARYRMYYDPMMRTNLW